MARVMDQEIKADWVAALRSPRYAQTDSKLRDEKGMCCLGVLCDRVDPEGWTVNEYGEFHHRLGSHSSACPISRDTNLAKSFAERIGLNGASPDGYDTEETLTNKNDGGANFDAIADWIEKYL